MKQVGARIIFDQDGEILFTISEMEGHVEDRKEISKLDFLDLPFGHVDFRTEKIVSVDAETKTIVLEKIITEETPEQIKIRELEDALLLQAEAELGGIL